MNTWYFEKDCNLEEFKASLAMAQNAAPTPGYATDTSHSVPIYDCNSLRGRIGDEGFRSGLMQEWSQQLQTGAGIVVFQNCFPDQSVIDEANAVYDEIMAEERARGGAEGDHFGAAGANARIWNALEKLCRKDPGLFIRYYSNVFLALISETWLGPNYQVTSQTNLIRPGSEGQTGHRDYHLGFQAIEEASYYPVTAHHFSPFLTLQGAIAHCDMPLETGPTKYLPFSQLYGPGYIAANLPEFKTYFEDNFVQIALKTGDAVFFNPAVFHGAGANTTRDKDRLANLLQVSSAFGRAIESVDRTAMCELVYPALLTGWQRKTFTEEQVVATVAACAEGYPFPTNLDRDPPIGGLVPKSQADIMLAAVERGLKQESFVRELHEHAEKRITHP